MKTKYVIFAAILTMLGFSVFSQINNQKNLVDNPILISDTVTTAIINTGGSIQWQKSADLNTWFDIPGQVNDSVTIIADSSMYIRAAVIYGNCNPYFSDTLFVDPFDPTICPATLTDFDGNVYNAVSIGYRCWMKENLRVTHYSDGVAIPLVTSTTDWDALFSTDPAYCYYDNSATNGLIYGALYTYPAVMRGAPSSHSLPSNVQGICPTGWHVPSDEEWKLLEGDVDSNHEYPDAAWDIFGWRGDDAGKNLKSTSGWNFSGNGLDLFGFNARPGGYRTYEGIFLEVGSISHWWVSTSSQSNSSGFFRRLSSNSPNIYRDLYNKSDGQSVRCVLDYYPAVLPTIISDSISDISQIGALCNAEITDDGGAEILKRGVCWSTSQNPTLSDDFLSSGSGSGVFGSMILGLVPGTTYYAKPYAINYVGTGYGNELSFTTPTSPTSFICGTSTVSDYDGNYYNTVHIGDQCWMKENLRTTHYENGVAIDYVPMSYAWEALTETDKGYCYLNNDTNLQYQYGALYTWAAIMNNSASSNSVPSGVQGLCPYYWHVPSDEEWKMLEGAADSLFDYPDAEWNGTGGRGYDASVNLKSTSSWNNNGNGTDLYGFSAMPGGSRATDGLFVPIGGYAYWWTSTEFSSQYAWFRRLHYTDNYIYRVNYRKDSGYGIRCVRDSVSNVVVLPTLTTDSITNITTTSALCTSEIIDNGGDTISARGVCWNTTGNPTVLDFFTNDIPGTGIYLSNLTNLSPGVTYKVRSYAINVAGTAYGNELSFTALSLPFSCGTTLVQDFDGNLYNTVQIGSQCWLKENLKSTHYSSGVGFPLITANSVWDTLSNTIPAYCYYNNDLSNLAQYGALYNWAAIMNGGASSNSVPSGVQGICPTGWHVPSDEEWKILEGEVDSLYAYPNQVWDNTDWRGYDAGKNLKSMVGWSVTGNGTDIYGFSALPGGSRTTWGIYITGGGYGNWASSFEYSSISIWPRTMANSYNSVNRFIAGKKSGFSVRCIKD